MPALRSRYCFINLSPPEIRASSDFPLYLAPAPLKQLTACLPKLTSSSISIGFYCRRTCDRRRSMICSMKLWTNFTPPSTRGICPKLLSRKNVPSFGFVAVVVKSSFCFGWLQQGKFVDFGLEIWSRPGRISQHHTLPPSQLRLTPPRLDTLNLDLSRVLWGGGGKEGNTNSPTNGIEFLSSKRNSLN